MLSDPIYKRDVTGRMRFWQYQLDGAGAYRTHAGIVGGATVSSEWTLCRPNAQRSTAIVQAEFEARAMERHKLERTYHRTETEAEAKGAHFFEPMLAKKYEGKVSFPIWVQPKLDGVRCIARAEGLFSRQGKRFLSCPHIEMALKPLFDADPDLILDGELYNHTHHDKFEKLISLIKKQQVKPSDIEQSSLVVQYHIYDLPSQEANFGDRWQRLLDLWTRDNAINECIRLVETHMLDRQDWLDQHQVRCLEQNYEGQMVRLDGPYEQKRSKNLLKRKEFEDEEFPISRIIEGGGNWTGYAKVVEFILPDDKRLENGERPRATLKGDQAFCKRIWELRDELVGDPVTVTSFGRTNAGIPRFPIATKIHAGGKL